MLEFKRRQDVVDWANQLDHRESVLFAGLWAARVWPFVTALDNWRQLNLDLACARAVLSALVCGRFDERILRKAAVHASDRLGSIDFGQFRNPFRLASIEAASFTATAGDVYLAACDWFSATAKDAEAGFDVSLMFADALGDQQANVVASRLWGARPGGQWQTEWSVLRARLESDPEVWGFWLEWYDGLIEGTEPDWAVWRDVVLIPDEVWEEGPEAVARAIEGIKGRLKAEVEKDNDPEPDDPDPSAQSKRTLSNIKAAVHVNTRELPPTFDDIQSLILLEMERLQRNNFLNAEAPHEVRAMTGTLLSLHDAVERLRALVPLDGQIDDPQAAEIESVYQLYKSKFAALPREKADEVVDGCWGVLGGGVRVSLIYASTSLGTLLGLPPHLAFGGAALVFAPKNAADLLKAAKEMFAKPSS